MKRSMKRAFANIAAAGFLLAQVPATFADVVAYPEKGQSAQQQSKDKYECYNWAKKQTGFDPQAAAGTAAPPSGGSSTGGGAVKGAGKGAAAGAVGGAIGGNAGKGAAIGAGVGGAAGAAKNRQSQKQAESQQQQAQSQAQQQMAAFNKAQSACLGGRGYSVG